jgi:hypothetical protein
VEGGLNTKLSQTFWLLAVTPKLVDSTDRVNFWWSMTMEVADFDIWMYPGTLPTGAGRIAHWLIWEYVLDPCPVLSLPWKPWWNYDSGYHWYYLTVHMILLNFGECCEHNWMHQEWDWVSHNKLKLGFAGVKSTTAMPTGNTKRGMLLY